MIQEIIEMEFDVVDFVHSEQEQEKYRDREFKLPKRANEQNREKLMNI